jgi:hypothetical protein
MTEHTNSADATAPQFDPLSDEDRDVFELRYDLQQAQAEIERLTKLAEANGGQARFWADHFAEIDKANLDALGAHHKPGHSVAELIAALVGELAEAREFGNDAMDKAQEIAKWVEGYGKLSADNKRLTRERDEARAEAAGNEATLDTVNRRLAEALHLDEVPLDEMLFMVGNIADELHRSVQRVAETGLRYEKLGRIPAGRHRLTIEVEVDDHGRIVQHLDVPGGVNIAGFWGSAKTLIESVSAPVSGSDTTGDEDESTGHDEMANEVSIDAVVKRMRQLVGKRVLMTLPPTDEEDSLGYLGNGMAGQVAEVEANVWVRMDYGPGMNALADGFTIREVPPPTVASGGDATADGEDRG